MTILILFHHSQYRTFKAFYVEYMRRHLSDEFPTLVSYKHFVVLMKRVGIPLWVYLRLTMGVCTGISFVDSTSLSIYHNRRIERHRVFEGWAERGKTTMGWIFGFKLHLVMNDIGKLIAVHLTPGNVDDRRPLPTLFKQVFGNVFGDKGYLSQDLKDQFCEQGIDLVTAILQNMTPQLMTLKDKLLLQRRCIIESVIGQLKHGYQIDRSRHRCMDNFIINLFAGLIDYCKMDNKPSIQQASDEYQALLALP
ncbi:MAG: IS982 family transposase [Chloroflexota bacterium]